ncbi:hypothetical protein niasHS_007679 [Heterodera schachtii]|uniref:B30.2/SPRY domain-containing protein n=2 Tax=Heterodera TaxID=34509 RepID=A0ABD2JPI0_HETSC
MSTLNLHFAYFLLIVVFLLVDYSLATRKKNKNKANAWHSTEADGQISGADKQFDKQLGYTIRDFPNSEASHSSGAAILSQINSDQQQKPTTDQSAGSEASINSEVKEVAKALKVYTRRGKQLSKSDDAERTTPTVGEQQMPLSADAAEENGTNSQGTAQEEKLQKIVDKLETNQKEMQRNIEEMLKEHLTKMERKMEAKVDEVRKAKEETLQQIVVKMEEYQNKLQRSIDQLIGGQKGNVEKHYILMIILLELRLTIGNRWDVNARENGIELSGHNELVVEHNGLRSGFRSVCAKIPIPKSGIFYFEIKDLNTFSSFAAVGLAPKHLPLGERAAYYDGINTDRHNDSYEFERLIQSITTDSPPLPLYKHFPMLNPGDVIGCGGVNLATRKIIYTKNGKCIDTPGLFLASVGADLFPCVTLGISGSKIEANFGPNFKYEIGNDQQ